MVDELVIKSIKNSIGLGIILWDLRGWRYEGKILDCSDDYLKIFDNHKQNEKFIRLDNILEVEFFK